MKKYMLDTNICIFIMKNSSERLLQNIVSHKKEDVCMSSISYSELLFGVSKSLYKGKNMRNLKLLIKDIRVIPYTQECADAYGAIRYELEKKGTPIGHLDMLIAAHSKTLGMSLVTNNTKEFSRVPGLDIEDWT